MNGTSAETVDLSRVRRIVIHCADTPDGDARYGADDIEQWHRKRNLKRRPEDLDRYPDIPYEFCGYHFVIEVDGALTQTRDLREAPQANPPFNFESVAICLMGRCRFTLAQWNTLAQVLIGLETGIEAQSLPPPLVQGHYEINSAKTCPGFNVTDWRARRMNPPRDHVCDPGKE